MGSASDDHGRRRAHVALVAFPFGTHAAPLLALAGALARASSASANFSFLSTASSLASLRGGGGGGGGGEIRNLRLVAIPDGGEGEEEGIGRFTEAGGILEGLRAAAAAAAAEEVSCVVSDAFVWAAGEAAEEMGVPWVPLWTGGPHSLLVHLRTDLLRSTIGVGAQVLRLQIWKGELLERRASSGAHTSRTNLGSGCAGPAGTAQADRADLPCRAAGLF